jgi:hypothetical protein
MAKTLAEVLWDNNPFRESQRENVPQFSRDLPKRCARFVITAAQNVTRAHPDFLACLQTYYKARRAELLVTPLLYKNVTSEFHGSAENARVWDAPLRPYLWNVRHEFNENLTLLAEFRTQPTAVTPLTGFDAVSLASSAIIGHTKLQLRSVATPQGKMAKTLTTTGAVTRQNYTDSKTGGIGGFHHSLSAVVVELDGKQFHMRQLHYSKSANRLIDLDTAYYPNGHVERAPRALALVGGDTHVLFADPAVLRGVRALAELVNPQWFVEHDLLDAYAVNPHHAGNYLTLLAKILSGTDCIETEAKQAAQYLAEQRRDFPDTQIAVVGSNHNDMLGRAVATFIRGGMQALPQVSAKNVAFLAELAARQARAVAMSNIGASYPDAFGLVLSDAAIPGVRAVSVDESFVLGDVELGMHGDRGPNGARGTVRNLARIGVKSITGHGHSHEIFEGHYRVGTRTRLRAEYTQGPGSWMNTDCLLNADGKRQLITYIDGRFTR